MRRRPTRERMSSGRFHSSTAGARRRPLAPLACLAGLFGLVACDRPSQPSGAVQPVAAQGAAKPAARVSGAQRLAAIPAQPAPAVNVVLFLIDTLRADRMSLYGHDRETTPFIDSLAPESVVFDQAQAPAPWTLPSVCSIMTSTFACEHGVIVDGQKIPAELLTLPELLRAVGYHTAQFYANGYAGSTSGLDRGFDVSRRETATTGDQIRSWLAERPAERPFFLYVHNVEPHQPHHAPANFVRRFGEVKPRVVKKLRALRSQYKRSLRADWTRGQQRGTTDNSAAQQKKIAALDDVLDDHFLLYDAAVRYADRNVRSVVRELRAAGVFDDCLFILLSDHGEELAEHGGYLHAQSVYDELARVPLLIRFPAARFGGRRVAPPVSLIDVVPSVCEYLARPDLLAQARGRSLLPLLESAAAPDSVRVTTVRINEKDYFKPWSEARGDINLAMRRGAWKGVFNMQLGTLELYDVLADAAERNDLSAAPERREEADAFRTFAHDWYAQCMAENKQTGAGGLQDLSEEDLRQLAALGYVDLPGQDQDSEGEPNTAP